MDTLSEDYQNGGLESVPLKAEEYSQLLISACSERQIILTAADSEGILFGEAANLQGLLFKHVTLWGCVKVSFSQQK